MLASELYALANGSKCEGDQECYWCGAPCTRKYLHDGPGIVPFQRNILHVKRPGNHWMCQGCCLFNRPKGKVTIRWLGGGYKDGQDPRKHSWWITDKGAHALPEFDAAYFLWPLLLNPPRRFCLAFTNDINYLHRFTVNENAIIKGETPLYFTLCNTPHTFTVYELEEALRAKETEGKESGVRTLVNLLGWYEIAKGKTPTTPKKKVGGRPPAKPTSKNTTGRVISQS